MSQSYLNNSFSKSCDLILRLFLFSNICKNTVSWDVGSRISFFNKMNSKSLSASFKYFLFIPISTRNYYSSTYKETGQILDALSLKAVNNFRKKWRIDLKSDLYIWSIITLFSYFLSSFSSCESSIFCYFLSSSWASKCNLLIIICIFYEMPNFTDFLYFSSICFFV